MVNDCTNIIKKSYTSFYTQLQQQNEIDVYVLCINVLHLDATDKCGAAINRTFLKQMYSQTPVIAPLISAIVVKKLDCEYHQLMP